MQKLSQALDIALSRQSNPTTPKSIAIGGSSASIHGLIRQKEKEHSNLMNQIEKLKKDYAKLKRRNDMKEEVSTILELETKLKNTQ